MNKTPRPAFGPTLCALFVLVAALAGSGAARAADWQSCPLPQDLAPRTPPSTTAFGWATPAAPLAATVEIGAQGCHFPADGSSRLAVRLRIVGADGRPPAGKTMLTLETTYGRWVWPDGTPVVDADPIAPGLQVEVEGGYLEIALESTNLPGRADIRAGVGGAFARASFEARPERRSPIAVGLAEGVFKIGSGAAWRPADPFEADLYSWSAGNGADLAAQARLSFFYKGPVGDKAMLSAGYDSIDDPNAFSFADPRPLDLFPIFGDGALTGGEALGSGRFWARLDQDGNYLMYGDPRKAARDPILSTLLSLGQPQYKPEALVGRLQSAQDGGAGRAVEGFASLGSATTVVQEFASQGSGPYALANSNGIDGTETVITLARDRNNPSAILWTKTLVRLVDYSFEPFSGRIILTQPLPAFDSNLNPEYLRITYSVDQGGPKFWAYGVAARVSPLPGLQLGAAYSNDENPLAGQQLGSAFGRWTSASGRTKVEAELAQSRSDSSNDSISPFSAPALANPGIYTGSAWRVGVDQSSDDGRFVFKGKAEKADADFFNPAGPGSSGMGDANGSATYQLNPNWKLVAQASGSTDANPSSAGVPMASSQNAKAVLAWSDNQRWTVEGGLGYSRLGDGAHTLAQTPYSDPSGNQPSLANGPYGGLGAGSPASTVDPVTGLSPTAIATAAEPAMDSTAAVAKAQWKVDDKLSFTALGQQSVSGEAMRETGIGADYAIASNVKLYARADWRSGLGSGFGSDGLGSGRTETVGISSSAFQQGSVFSEYRLADTASGTDTVQASGVRNVWTLKPGIKLGAGFEQVHSFSSISPSSQAITASFEIATSPDWRASQKIEVRQSGNYVLPAATATTGTTSLPATSGDNSFSSVLSESYAAARLSRDWSLLGRLYLLTSNSAANGNGLAARAQIGAAYRDVQTNRSNALFAWERRDQRDPDAALAGSNGVITEVADTVSATADWHPRRPWWLTGRLAWQERSGVYENDTPDDYHGVLASGRATWDFTSTWDVSLLASLLRDNTSGTERAWGLEGGRIIAANLWVGAGWNFAGFSADPSLAGSSVTQQGFFIRLRYKFDERLFSGSDHADNRSLDASPAP